MKNDTHSFIQRLMNYNKNSVIEIGLELIHLAFKKQQQKDLGSSAEIIVHLRSGVTIPGFQSWKQA